MSKTKILLAFGRHGTDGKGANKRFFRKKVGAFLKARRKGIVIAERTTEFDDIRPDSEVDRERHQHILTRIEETENDLLRTFVEQGVLIPRCFGEFTDLKHIANFGILEQILRINRANHGQIRVIIEPQIAEAIYAIWERENAREEERASSKDLFLPGREEKLIEKTLKNIETTLCALRIRDNAVVEMVERIIQEDPERAIVIPRGAYHFGMHAFFDPNRYDITLAYDGTPTTFVADAVIESYYGELGIKALRKYAQLEIILLGEIGERINKLKYRVLSALSEGISDYIMMRVMKRVKKEIITRFKIQVDEHDFAKIRE